MFGIPLYFKFDFLNAILANKRVLLNKCWQKPEKGLCKALFKRFYFDQNTRSCQLFNYGGCGGNANNFFTLNECYNSCKTFGGYQYIANQSVSAIGEKFKWMFSTIADKKCVKHL